MSGNKIPSLFFYYSYPNKLDIVLVVVFICASFIIVMADETRFENVYEKYHMYDCKQLQSKVIEQDDNVNKGLLVARDIVCDNET